MAGSIYCKSCGFTLLQTKHSVITPRNSAGQQKQLSQQEMEKSVDVQSSV